MTDADPLTYEAEKLFGIDLNDDEVQGRNVQEISKTELANSYGWKIFESEVEDGGINEDPGPVEIDDINPTTNSKNDFTKTVEVIIPQYSEEGIWTLDSIDVNDAAGNSLYITRDSEGYYRYYDTDEIVDLGF